MRRSKRRPWMAPSHWRRRRAALEGALVVPERPRTAPSAALAMAGLRMRPATNSTGNALAVSQASGGNGGLLQPGTKNTARATPGNAMATATANAQKGDATAD